VRYLHGAIRDARLLAERVDAAGAHAQRNLVLDLLEIRMDAHAASLALDEAYAAALYDGSPDAPAMSRDFKRVRRLINLFDVNLQKNLPLLRLAASTYLLDNWRRLLAPAHRDCPPWWLDGCIG
jgi:transcriptional regulator GlxA family with amidase domain